MTRIVLFLLIITFPACLFGSGVIRINQLGYFPQARKVAVFLSDQRPGTEKFQIYNSLSGKLAFESAPVAENGAVWQRCGFNPFLNDSCHVDDGIIVDHPSRRGSARKIKLIKQ